MSVKNLLIAKNRADRRRHTRMSELINRICPTLSTGTVDELFNLDMEIQKSELTNEEVELVCNEIMITINRIQCRSGFTLYWYNGTRTYIEGDKFTQAFVQAGYKAESMESLAFYMVGDDRFYDYVDGKWRRKVPINYRIVYMKF